MSAVETISPRPSQPWRAEVMELLSSMRFAIALLTVICIVSAIGTVLKQGEPLVNYVDQFGPFWADVFGALGLFRVYSTPWFLIILAFLVLSTSLCIARNLPKILVDVRTFKEHIREQSLQAFHHRAEGVVAKPLDQAQASIEQQLSSRGWKFKTDARAHGVMIGARQGAANKIGYLAAHGAIVLICLGGLFDGDLIVKVQAWMHDLQPFRGGTVTDNSRLSVSNPAYRAQLFVPEGQRSASAVLNLDKGMLLQPLPFEVELKKFSVDYYETGMPKRFASDIVIHDDAKGISKPFTVEVNHPVTYDGVTIFQSSFEDGGSLVQLKPVFLNGRSDQLPSLPGQVGGAPMSLPAALAPQGGGTLTMEVTGLRLINVENMAEAQDGAAAGATDVRGVNLSELSKHLGSAAKAPGDKKLTNIGPSVTYKLRDQAGQAREFQNFMAPVMLNGQMVFLLGVRDTPAEGFRYLRIPADASGSMAGWLHLRQALLDESARREAVARFVKLSAPAGRADVAAQVTLTAQRALDLFAGAVKSPHAAGAPDAAVAGGLQALSDFIENVIPPAEREHTSATLVRILNGVLFELYNVSRERAGLQAVSLDDEATRNFMTAAVLTLSDAVFYPVPVVFTLESFQQRQASVFQVTRTPGRNVVYLGCLLLVIGVFAMLYIRERRVWVWLQSDDNQGGTSWRMALSSTRQSLDTDDQFEQLRAALLAA